MIRAYKLHKEKGKFLLGLGIVLFFITIAAAAPFLSTPKNLSRPNELKIVGKPYDVNPYPPSPGIPLGTTPGQIDIFHTLVWGTRTALVFGLTITITTAIFGVFLGAISGYYRGRLANIILRITELFLSFPMIAGLAVVNSLYANQVSNLGMSITDPNPFIIYLIDKNIHPIMFTLILFSWMPYVKLTNIIFIQQMSEDYVQASIAMGASSSRIILKHVLPNILSPIIVLAAKSIGGLVVLDSGLTYIGISGATDWGKILLISRDWIVGSLAFSYWWLFFPSTITIIMFGLGWNLLGDQLSTLLDSRKIQ